MTQALEHSSGGPTDKGSAAAWDQLRSLLVAGETITAHALQHRIYALSHRRSLAAATTGRFIFLTRPLLGGYEPVAVRWQDIKEVQITVGMFSATISLSYSANLSDTAQDEGQFQTLRVSGLKMEAAQALYRECQAQEQSWREKRRVRSMEEMRARSGGAQIATGIYPGAGLREPVIEHAGPSSQGETPAQRLSRAKEMMVEGLITDSEYEAIKAKIIGAL
jgi:hypothetical protein